MDKLIIVGSGETGNLIYEYITHDSEYDVVAFSEEKKYKNSDKKLGLPIIPLEDIQQYYSVDNISMITAIGYSRMNADRTKVYNLCRNMGYKMISYISSNSTVWHDVKIGENCVIMEESSIQYGASIGNNCVIWPTVTIGHRCEIGNNCWISSGCAIGGLSKVGDNSFLGINSIIKDSIVIGKQSLVGAGTYINKDADEYSIYVNKGTDPVDKDVMYRKRMQKFFL